MPNFVQLSEEEKAQYAKRGKGPSVIDYTPFREYLQTLQAGDIGAIDLEAEDNKTSIKRRLTTSAKDMGLGVKWRKGTDTRLVFLLTQAEPEEEEPGEEKVAPLTRRRKSATVE